MYKYRKLLSYLSYCKAYKNSSKTPYSYLEGYNIVFYWRVFILFKFVSLTHTCMHRDNFVKKIY